ncbi:hypothetical protein HDV03_002878 [Kappamyces sp. JEL0829]|nr:hypothetical protein HDV03_002878 [Kappamyces sp. JEL0829]
MRLEQTPLLSPPSPSPRPSAGLARLLLLFLCATGSAIYFWIPGKENSTTAHIFVDPENVLSTLKEFERIADTHGHSRSVVNGHMASVDYIRGQLLQFPSLEVMEQELSVLVQVDEAEPFLSLKVSKRSAPKQFKPRLEIATVSGSGSAKVADARVYAWNACDRSLLTRPDSGWVALIDATQTSCSPCDRLVSAVELGASAAIFVNKPGNQQGYPHPLPPQPGRCSRTPKYVPHMAKIGILSLSDDAAFAFLSAVAATKKATVTLTVHSAFRDFVTKNILATSKGGNRDEIVLFSSHLDSVPAGPGINDDGSGAAATLELARAFDSSALSTTNKPTVQFAWWTGEEIGLLGSRFYVKNLTENAPDELRRYKLNIDTDMIASPNYVRGVWDGEQLKDAKLRKMTGKVSRMIVDWFGQQGLPSFLFPFNGRSDFQPFLDALVPAGGVITGEDEIKDANSEKLFGGVAGEVLDPCYHQDCDRVAGILGSGYQIMTENMGVLGYLLETFSSIDGVEDFLLRD